MLNAPSEGNLVMRCEKVITEHKRFYCSIIREVRGVLTNARRRQEAEVCWREKRNDRERDERSEWNLDLRQYVDERGSFWSDDYRYKAEIVMSTLTGYKSWQASSRPSSLEDRSWKSYAPRDHVPHLPSPYLVAENELQPFFSFLVDFVRQNPPHNF
jgi:hypothetical protein